MSPSHQVRQTEPSSPVSISLPTSRLATPIVALTIVLTRGGEQRQRGDVADPFERGPEVRDALQQVGAGERLERVPDGDPERRVERHVGPGVGEEGAERHPGPDPIAPQQDRRERDPGRRPDRGHARGGEGEVETELRGQVVGRRERGDPHRIRDPPAPVRRSKAQWPPHGKRIRPARPAR